MLYVIICANFGVEKLRGLRNTRGQILEFPIEMAGHPYNRAGATAQPVIVTVVEVIVGNFLLEVCKNIARGQRPGQYFKLRENISNMIDDPSCYLFCYTSMQNLCYFTVKTNNMAVCW